MSPKESCNNQACAGDEICIAKQDLVIALDASGSLKEKGCDIVKRFAVNLTQKYVPKYFGNPAVKIGVALFGNGNLMDLNDGSGGTTIQAIFKVSLLILTKSGQKSHTPSGSVDSRTWHRRSPRQIRSCRKAGGPRHRVPSW